MNKLNLNKLLNEALASHKEGNLDKADKIYLKILEESPSERHLL